MCCSGVAPESPHLLERCGEVGLTPAPDADAEPLQPGALHLAFEHPQAEGELLDGARRGRDERNRIDLDCDDVEATRSEIRESGREPRVDERRDTESVLARSNEKPSLGTLGDLLKKSSPPKR